VSSFQGSDMKSEPFGFRSEIEAEMRLHADQSIFSEIALFTMGWLVLEARNEICLQPIELN